MRKRGWFTASTPVLKIPAARMQYRDLGRERSFLRGRAFQSLYSDHELAELAGRVGRLASATHNVHMLFNNNDRDYAQRNALRLREVLGA